MELYIGLRGCYNTYLFHQRLKGSIYQIEYENLFLSDKLKSLINLALYLNNLDNSNKHYQYYYNSFIMCIADLVAKDEPDIDIYVIILDNGNKILLEYKHAKSEGYC